MAFLERVCGKIGIWHDPAERHVTPVAKQAAAVLVREPIKIVCPHCLERMRQQDLESRRKHEAALHPSPSDAMLVWTSWMRLCGAWWL